MTSPLPSPGSWHFTVVRKDLLIREGPSGSDGVSFHATPKWLLLTAIGQKQSFTAGNYRPFTVDEGWQKAPSGAGAKRLKHVHILVAASFRKPITAACRYPVVHPQQVQA